MLACIGPVIFDIVNDLQSIDVEVSTSLAKHDVIGAGPTYEVTGDDETIFTLRGILHPLFIAEVLGVNALAGINALELARQTKVPLPFLTGNYAPKGWVLIKSIKRSDTDLDASGIGTDVEYTLDLVLVGTPDSGAAASILRLFL